MFANANLMKFNKNKCTWAEAISSMNIGWMEKGQRAMMIRTWECWLVRSSTVCACSLQSQSYLGLLEKKHGQQVKGHDSPSPLWSPEIPSGVLCPALEFPRKEEHRTVRIGPEEDHEGDQNAEATFL